MQTTNKNPDTVPIYRFQYYDKFRTQSDKFKRKKTIKSVLCKIQNKRRCGSSVEDAKLCIAKYARRCLVLAYENSNYI